MAPRTFAQAHSAEYYGTHGNRQTKIGRAKLLTPGVRGGTQTIPRSGQVQIQTVPLQGTANYIPPQGTGNSYIRPLDPAQQQNLANIEALLNIIANGAEILGVANGIPILLLAGVLRRLPDRKHLSGALFALGFIALIGGLALPDIINWFVAPFRDANLFG